jgi:hypothetical protein
VIFIIPEISKLVKQISRGGTGDLSTFVTSTNEPEQIVVFTSERREANKDNEIERDAQLFDVFSA